MVNEKRLKERKRRKRRKGSGRFAHDQTKTQCDYLVVVTNYDKRSVDVVVANYDEREFTKNSLT